MVVCKTNFPTIYRAFSEIAYDNAMEMAFEFDVPDSAIRVLPTVERTLSLLSENDLLTVCVGEHTDQELIKALSRDNEFAFELLSEFFDGFHDWP